MSYKELTSRNEGYVSSEIQKQIRNAKLLLAGCGVGSTIGDAAVRLGFEQFRLVDDDVIEIHNLNRQAFRLPDIGRKKVHALADILRSINPEVVVEPITDPVTPENAEEIVKGIDIVVDMIDFLSLDGIVALHDACKHQNKPIITALSAGWGAVGMYFPPHGMSFRELFDLPLEGSVEKYSYIEVFGNFVKKMPGILDDDILQALRKIWASMKDNIPCPASHISPGSFASAGLAVTMAVRLLSNRKVVEAPFVIDVNLSKLCMSSRFSANPVPV